MMRHCQLRRLRRLYRRQADRLAPEAEAVAAAAAALGPAPALELVLPSVHPRAESRG